jgi:hypothetical protein
VGIFNPASRGVGADQPVAAASFPIRAKGSRIDRPGEAIAQRGDDKGVVVSSETNPNGTIPTLYVSAHGCLNKHHSWLGSIRAGRSVTMARARPMDEAGVSGRVAPFLCRDTGERTSSTPSAAASAELVGGRGIKNANGSPRW